MGEDVKTCVICGLPLPKRRSKYCSDKCMRVGEAKRKRESSGRPTGNPDGRWLTHCIDCGVEIYRPIKCKRCEACQDRINRINKSIIQAKGPRRPLGSTDKCQRCGRGYIVESGMQKYCKACAHVATLEAKRDATRAYMAAKRADPVKREEINAAKRVVKQDKPCAKCGKPFRTTSRGLYCSDACRKAAKADYYRAYGQEHTEVKIAKARERRKAMTQEQRDAINARARENYRKRKEREKNGENGQDGG